MTNKKTKNETDKKTETQETQSPVNDNKTVFGPLGKYAVVAVIMVSIIVTTAIMLDKQLNTVEQHIAEIENEVASIDEFTDTGAADDEANVAESSDTENVPAAATKAAEAQESPAAVQTQEVAVTEVSAEELKAAVIQAAAKPTVIVTSSEISNEDNSTSQQVSNIQANSMIEKNKQVEDQAREYQARIEAYKLEQKQRMAQMFARIKELESSQLTQYKGTQDKQIARLRDQSAQQQAMIDALILRNKDLFEMRAANVQRKQTRREEILNRI